MLCPHCASTAYSWAPVSGRGVVRTWSVIHNASDAWFRIRVPYIVAIIELENTKGLRMIANIVNCTPADVHSGMRVVVTFEPVDETRKMYAFEPGSAAHT